MKTTLIFAFALLIFTCSAAVPLSWTVETSRVQPAVFEAYQGETLTFEAALQSNGKPLAAPVNYSFFWQTNGMGSTFWEVKVRGEGEQRNNSTVHLDPSPSPTNVLFATWSPEMDVGAKVYNCFIGSPSNIYHAAFQLRLRPSPGALPNALPLPTPVIDFARIRVLNPPWGSGGGGGGCDTNAVDILANSAVVTNALTVATTNRVAALETAADSLASSVSGLASSLAEKANSADIPVMVKETMSADGISSSYINIGGSISGQTVGDQYGDLRTAINGKADKGDISATNPTFSNEVATVARTITPPPSPTLRLYDEVRQCYWIGRMVNGVINWEVE